ncbi:MAG: hypothetical protein ACTSRG_25065 [Candidatus Helarchaeota archaeon]
MDITQGQSKNMDEQSEVLSSVWAGIAKTDKGQSAEWLKDDALALIQSIPVNKILETHAFWNTQTADLVVKNYTEPATQHLLDFGKFMVELCKHDPDIERLKQDPDGSMRGIAFLQGFQFAFIVLAEHLGKKMKKGGSK